MARPAVVGVDIGTSSSKGVLVDLGGTVLPSAVREHAVDRPGPGTFEMDAEMWWDEFVALTRICSTASARTSSRSGSPAWDGACSSPHQRSTGAPYDHLCHAAGRRTAVHGARHGLPRRQR